MRVVLVAGSAAWVLCGAGFVADAFTSPRPSNLVQTSFATTTVSFPHARTAVLFSSSLPSDDNDDDGKEVKKDDDTGLSKAQELRAQARRVRLEADRMEATLTLKKVDVLETKLKKAVDDPEIDKQELQLQIEALAQRTDPTFNPRLLRNSRNDGSTSSSSMTKTLPPLSPAALAEVCAYFNKLPPQMRVALAAAVGVSVTVTSTDDPATIEGVVSKLYCQQEDLLTTDRLSDALTDVMYRRRSSSSTDDDDPLDEQLAVTSFQDAQSLDDLYAILNDMDMTNMTADGARNARFMESAFPRQTRRENTAPTAEEADDFLNNVLLQTKRPKKGNPDKDVVLFNPVSKPEEVPGGWIIRGGSKMEDSEAGGNTIDMVQAIDETFLANPKLADNYNFYYVEDPTPEAMEDLETFLGKPVLLFTGRDLSPTTDRFVLSGISVLSFTLILLFALGGFGNNDLVVNKLSDANAVGDYDTSWFTALLVPLLGSIAGIQLAHEGAHLTVANLNNFKMAAPTFLPSLNLPYFGCSTSVKSSPPDRTALFDFAAAGPAVGLLLSSAVLYVGLTLTVGADTETLKFFPTFPVALLQSSALGGTLVDSFLGQVLTTNFDPDVATLQLHPLAIGGYCGLVVNALNLLPLGSTDGGRISQTIFGRSGHSVIQGFVYICMFGSTFFGGDKSNILLGYALIVMLGQGEMEIPCRNEIENVPIPRVFAAIALWFVVALTLIPLT